MNKIPLVELPSDIKEPEAFALQEILCQLFKDQPLQIVLDFSKTSLVDFGCSEILLNSIQSIKRQGIETVCWSINKSVMNTLTSMKFTELVSVDLDTNVDLSLIYNSKDVKSMVLYGKIKSFLVTHVQSLLSKTYKT